MDRSQMEECLVVKLYPNQPAGESCSVDTINNLHDRERGSTSTVHERRRSPAQTREIGIFDAPFQVVLPQRNGRTWWISMEKRPMIFGTVLRNTWEPCQYREMDERTSIFQPSRTVSTSPKTNPMRVRPSG